MEPKTEKRSTRKDPARNRFLPKPKPERQMPADGCERTAAVILGEQIAEQPQAGSLLVFIP